MEGLTAKAVSLRGTHREAPEKGKVIFGYDFVMVAIMTIIGRQGGMEEFANAAQDKLRQFDCVNSRHTFRLLWEKRVK